MIAKEKVQKKYEKIPYFIRMRGCINCGVSKSFKEKHGRDYGFDHEINVGCSISGCYSRYGFSLLRPFMDPEDIAKHIKSSDKPGKKWIAKRISKKTKKTFGKYYKTMGVSIDDIFNNIADK